MHKIQKIQQPNFTGIAQFIPMNFRLHPVHLKNKQCYRNWLQGN